MPVRFECTACGQLLSVSRRKVGMEVRCPKCQAALVVPLAGNPSVLPFVSEEAARVRWPIPGQAEPLAPQISGESSRSDEMVRTETAPPLAISDCGVALSRSVLYVQAVGILILALAALAIGHWAGASAWK